MKKGIVTRDHVNRASTRQRELAGVNRIKRIGTILVEMGFISIEELKGFIETEIVEAVKDILEVDDISVMFLTNEETLKFDITTSVDIECLIEKKLEFIEKARLSKENEASLGDVFVIAVEPDRMQNLSTNAWKVLVLLDGMRTITELSRVSGLSLLQINSVIEYLVERKIIKRVETEPISKPMKMYLKMKKPMASTLYKIVERLRAL
ncbi:MAG: hypothetical protein GY771_13205 [bacterium]|nr:hypothetical protein [bacterium]